MPKLYSSTHICRVLASQGFVFISQRGSHMKYRKFGNPSLTVIVPVKKRQIPIGTFKSILRQSKLSNVHFG
jgi:predicted RNA binding protein YcfA (HicA-like mRNA interferase family)